jgi:hypothetical protein
MAAIVINTPTSVTVYGAQTSPLRWRRKYALARRDDTPRPLGRARVYEDRTEYLYGPWPNIHPH